MTYDAFISYNHTADAACAVQSGLQRLTRSAGTSDACSMSSGTTQACPPDRISGVGPGRPRRLRMAILLASPFGRRWVRRDSLTGKRPGRQVASCRWSPTAPGRGTPRLDSSRARRFHLRSEPRSRPSLVTSILVGPAPSRASTSQRGFRDAIADLAAPISWGAKGRPRKRRRSPTQPCSTRRWCCNRLPQCVALRRRSQESRPRAFGAEGEPAPRARVRPRGLDQPVRGAVLPQRLGPDPDVLRPGAQRARLPPGPAERAVGREGRRRRDPRTLEALAEPATATSCSPATTATSRPRWRPAPGALRRVGVIGFRELVSSVLAELTADGPRALRPRGRRRRVHGRAPARAGDPDRALRPVDAAALTAARLTPCRRAGRAAGAAARAPLPRSSRRPPRRPARSSRRSPRRGSLRCGP